MHHLTYKRIFAEDDIDIPQLTAMHQIPEVAQYICIGDNYFHYVTNSKNVFYYKVYENDVLIGSIHLEKQETVLYMDILVFPNFQRVGLGTQILKDIQNDIFQLRYERIEISIDERNTASLRLFKKAGFIRTAKEDALIFMTFAK